MSPRQKSFRFVVALSTIIALTAITFAASSWRDVFILLPFASANTSASDGSAEAVPVIQQRMASPQSVLVNSTFEPGDPTVWTAANAVSTNQWFIGTATNNGGTQAAYISNDGGVTSAYTLATTSLNHIYTPVNFPAGETAIILSFDWRGIGEPSTTGGSTFDYLRVSLTSAAPTAGAFTAVGDQLPVIFSAASLYQKGWVVIPASNAGTTKNLVFTWRNDSSLGNSTPGPAIDNVVLTSTTPAPLTGFPSIGPGGTYTSFGQAVANLNANGVGPTGVTFGIAANLTFNETVPAITTTGSVTQPIVFEKTGPGANPKIISTGTGNFGPTSTAAVAGGGDGVIVIHGADYITFDGIDVASGNYNPTNSAIEGGFILRNASATDGAQNNTIRNSAITMNRTIAAATTPSAGIHQSISANQGGISPTSSAGANSNNKYQNLTITSSYVGIWLQGLPAFPDDGNQVGVTGAVTRNTIGAATANDIGNGASQTYGIRTLAQSNSKILNTEIRNVTGTSTSAADGIFVENAGSTVTSVGTVEVANNIVHDIKSTSTSSTSHVVSGIRVNLTGNALSNSRVYNNFVYGLDNQSANTTSRQLIGLRVQDQGSGAGALHEVSLNSVRIAPTGIGFQNTALEIGTTSGPVMNIRSNILSNFTGAQTGTAKHYAWVTTSTTLTGNTGSISNFNDLFISNTTNGFVGLTNATDRATLADWQTAVSQDANSISSDPLFFGATDLHLTGLSPAINTGTSIPAVVTDIDGETRPNGAAFEIGADEFYPNPGQVQFEFSTYNRNEGNADTVTVTRSGGSSGAVSVDVSSGGGTATGGAACTAGVDYISISTTLSFPDGVTSQTFPVTLCTDNDTEVAETFNLTLSNPMGGVVIGSPSSATVTINNVAVINGTINVGTGQTYTSLTNAGGLFEAINNGVVTSNTIVNIISNLTSETGTFALNAINESPMGSNFTIIFQPSGGARTISGSNATALIVLNGADRVTFDGFDTAPGQFLIRNTGAGNVFRFINDASSNGVINSTIEGSAGATSILISTAAAGGAGNDNIVLNNNTIRDRSDITSRPSVMLSNAGTTTAGLTNSNLMVTNNQFFNFQSTAISSTIGTENTTISGNTIFETFAQTTALVGINFAGLGTNTISVNAIFDLNTSGTVTAIQLGDARGTTVSRNTIRSILSASGSTSTIQGINFSGSSGNPSSVTIVNNMVSIVPSFTNAQVINGIRDFAFSGNTFSAYFNTVLVGGTSSGASSSWACVRGTAAPTNYSLINNICFNNRTGGTGNHFAVGDQTADGLGTYSSNYNIFVGTGSIADEFYDYGTNSTGTPATFLEWQTGPPTRDANSQSSNPGGNYTVANMFLSTTDLHLNTSGTNPAVNAGIAAGGITTDFDGETRPDGAAEEIGADEVSLVANPGTLQFSAATYSGGEGAGTISLTVSRTGGSSGAVGATVSFGGGTATGGAACGGSVDYDNDAQLVAFADGDVTPKNVLVPICDDATIEGNETFDGTLGSFTGGATGGSILTSTVTITDNDVAQPGTLALSTASSSIGENGVTATITVTRTGGSDGTVGVSYSTTAGGTATGGGACGGGVDYQTTSGTLSWNNGDSTSKTFTITICDDTTDEPDETVNLAITTPTGGATLGTPNTAVLTITDNDNAPAISIGDSTQGEGNGGTVSHTFTVTLSNPSSSTVTVGFATASNTATGGGSCSGSTDFISQSGTVTFVPTDVSETITVLGCGDTVVEPTETFFVNLSSPSNGTINDDQGLGTITNDDTSFQFTSATYLVNEGVGTGSFTVTRTGVLTGTDMVTAATVAGGTATGGASCTAGIDYITTSPTLTFNPSDTSKTLDVTFCNDNLFETPNETVNIALSSPSVGTLGTPNTAVVTIDENDTAPSLQFNSPTYGNGDDLSVSISKGNDPLAPEVATITVTRTGATENAVSVNFATVAGGSATAGGACLAGSGVDYVSTNGTLNFVSGDSVETFDVTVCTDLLFEGNETVNLALSSPSAPAVLGAQNTAVLTITDNETAPTLQFSSATYSNSDDLTKYGETTDDFAPSVATITVTRTGATDNAVSVNFATMAGGTATGGASCTTGIDYVNTNGTLNFALGDTSETFNVTVCTDALFEGSETVNLALSSPSAPAVLGTPNSAVLTILDNDAQPSLQFSAATYSVSEAGPTATITVTRTGATDNAVSVQYATSNGSATGGATCTAGVDYNPASGTLNFIAGDTSETFTVPICEDAVAEANETVNLTLSNPGGGAVLGAQNTAVLTINDNEGALSISIGDSTVSEGNSGTTSATFTVSLSGPSASNVTVDFATANGTTNPATGGATCTGGTDYITQNGTVTFTPGDTQEVVTIAVCGDTTFEPNETFFVNLSGNVGATINDGQGLGTINNDDAAPTPVLTIAKDFTTPGNDPTDTPEETATAGSAGNTFFIVVANTGTGAATNVVITDVVPAALTVTNVSGTLGSEVPPNGDNNINWSIPSLAAGQSATLTVTYSVPSATNTQLVNNTASVDSDETTPVQDSDDVQIVESVTLTIAKDFSNPGNDPTDTPEETVTAGSSNNTFFIVVTNTGISSADNVVISDVVPAALTVTNVTGTLGTNGTIGNTVQWNIATLNAGQSATITVTYSVPSSINTQLVNNTASVSSDEASPVQDSDDVQIIENATLTLAKDFSNPGNDPTDTPEETVNAGSSGNTFFVTVTNTGVSTADNVVITDGVPAQLTVTNVSATIGTAGNVGNTVQWNIATLNAGQSATMTVTYSVDSTVPTQLVNNTASVTSDEVTTPAQDSDDVQIVGAGTLQFSSPTYGVSETGPTVTINVTRTGGSAGIVGVTYATVAGGTATGGASCSGSTDYVSTTNTLSWANGDTANKTFTVTICDDTLFESNETVNLALSLPTGGATLGAQSTAVLTITENDTQPSLQFSSATYSVGEGGGSVTITVTRTGATGNAVSVNYASVVGGTATGSASCGAGVDYVNAGGTLNFVAGDSSETFNVTICDDALIEGSETVNLALSSPSGATLGTPNTAVLTITDNDSDTTAPVITYTPIPSNPGVTTLTATITDAVGVTGASIFWSINGGSFTSAPCTPLGGTPQNGTWTCTITGTGNPNAVAYYVTASDASANTGSNPSGGASAPNVFTIGAGVVAAGTYTNANLGSGSSIGGNVTVNGVLTLAGIVTTGANTLTLNCNATIVGGGESNYVVGNLEKLFCGVGVFTFQVGAAFAVPPLSPEGVVSNYSPLSVNVLGGQVGSSLTVSVTDNFLTGSDQTNSISRFWTVTENGNLTADMSYVYRNEDVVGSEASYNVLRRSGGVTANYPGGTVNGATNTATAPGVTDFSDWGVGTLPVQPEITLSSSAYIDDESHTLVVTVERDIEVGGPSSVTFTTSNGTATGVASCPVGGGGSGGTDYEIKQTVVNITGTAQQVNIPLCGDLSKEFNETFTITLSNPVNGTLGSPSSATVTINDAATQFTNTAPITINDGGPATPYPSTINVTGAPSSIYYMRVTIFDVAADNAEDLKMLLVGPGGQTFVLMADAGGSGAIAPGTTLTFNDNAAAFILNSSAPTSGSYKPTSYSLVPSVFPPPAPAVIHPEPGPGLGRTALMNTVFGGLNANGVWSLYVFDDTAPLGTASGVIAAGWGIELLAPTAAALTVTGRVADASGQGLSGVSLTLEGGPLTVPMITRSNSFGHYSFVGMEPGAYLLTINSRRYVFTVPSRTLILTDDLSGVDFIAEPEE